MLVDHAKTTLDQSSVVETEKDQQVTGGIKISTYFNLLVRPYHSPASRVMKEMNHVAVCLDELRSGQLGRLGDSLSSRRRGLRHRCWKRNATGALCRRVRGRSPGVRRAKGTHGGAAEKEAMAATLRLLLAY